MRKLWLIAAVLSLSFHASARTWKSADGSKTFEGKLRSYDRGSGTVKVIMSNGSLMTFKAELLSGEDREFLLSQGTNSSSGGEQDFTAELEKTKLGKQISSSKLKLVDGRRFKTAKLDKAPEYYILYFSASW